MRLRALAVISFIYFLASNAYAFETVSSFYDNSNPVKVLLFLSRNCPCSRSHVDHLNILQKDFPNAVFFGVITDEIDGENKNQIEDYFNKTNFKFSIIKDIEQKLVKEFDALKTPHVTVVKKQPNGQYTRIYEGGVTDNRHFPNAKVYFLKENLVAIKEDKPLPHANGKSLGCYIRRL